MQNTKVSHYTSLASRLPCLSLLISATRPINQFRIVPSWLVYLLILCWYPNFLLYFRKKLFTYHPLCIGDTRLCVNKVVFERKLLLHIIRIYAKRMKDTMHTPTQTRETKKCGLPFLLILRDDHFVILIITFTWLLNLHTNNNNNNNKNNT